MSWSIQIGTIFGIPLRMHLTFLLILLYGSMIAPTAWGMTPLVGVLFIIALFACVVIHELSHSLMARSYGINVREIILLPIGGVANMEKMPDEPRQELAVAAVGPAASLLIAAVLGALTVILYGTEPLFAPMQAESGRFIAMLTWLNVFLAAFNMLPAFPMDGGRVLRALLAMRMDYAQATRAAAAIGQGFALLLAFVGLMSNIWLLVIALFIYMGAGAESTQVRFREALRGIRAYDAMITQFRTLNESDTLADAFGWASRSYQHDFPVVENGEYVGMVTRQDLIRGMHELTPDTPVSEIMTRATCSIAPGAQLEEAYRIIAEGGCPIIAVQDEEFGIVGVITPESVNNYMVSSAYQRRALKS